MNGVIIWFRRDLRLRDNPALIWAVEQGFPVVVLYIDYVEEEGEWASGGASRWWLGKSLDSLSKQLAGQGLRLHFFRGQATDVLFQVAHETAITNVVCTRLAEPHLQAHDRKSKEQLAEAGITLHIVDEWHLLQPDSLLNQQGKPYKVFTPFWKRLRRELTDFSFSLTEPRSSPHLLKPSPRQPSGGVSVAELALCDNHPWQQKLAAHWQPGELFAWQRLELFFGGMLDDYPVSRDRPAVDGTSMLSPHLHFGEITARQIFHELLPLLDHSATSAAAEAWLRQLGWAEFARYVLWHFPYTTDQPMDPRFDINFWQMGEVKFTAWKKGETGIAIIDAGMQQLWQSGWMHNRVRMLVASFLTKNLGLPWQAGARWFWETLVDADLANNSMGWQWVAGCGVDASPYFRIFNPVTQAQRFDQESVYCRHWLGDECGQSTRQPLVDLKRSREQALERYQSRVR